MVNGWRDVFVPVRTIFSEYFSFSRGTLLLITLVIILSSTSGVIAPYLFSRLIDQLNTDAWAVQLVYGFALYAILIGVADLLAHISTNMSLITSEKLHLISTSHFFKRISRKTTSFFIDHNAAEISSAKNQGSRSLYEIILLGFNFLLPGVVRIIVTLAVLGSAISIDIMFVVIVYGFGFVSLTYFVNQWTMKYLDAAVEAKQENAKFTGNAINAMETLRYAGSETWILGRFNSSAQNVYDNWRQFALRKMAFGLIYSTAVGLQIGITFAILLPRFREGSMSVGDIVLFFMLLAALNWPFQMIAMIIDRAVRAYSDFQPFAKMWHEPEEAEVNSQIPLNLKNGRIEFIDVGYKYDGGRGIENISFYAERGKITYITGETGAGKSTLLKLALKAFAPREGRIIIDGLNLSEINRRSWYSEIGIVPQDIMLLNETLKTNIVLGRELDEKRLLKATQKAAILSRIEDMPDQFDTVVGERGLKLSVGERQRIALARALYSEPKILFLDEASSALDEQTEEEIMKHIREFCDEVTVLAITHRMASVKTEDHVVHIVSGGEMKSEVRAHA